MIPVLLLLMMLNVNPVQGLSPLHSRVVLNLEPGLSGEVCIETTSAEVDQSECWQVKSNVRKQIVRDWTFPVPGAYQMQATFEGVDKDNMELHISTPVTMVFVN